MPKKRVEPTDDKPEPKPKCERCRSKKVVPILWGLPTPETFEMYERYKEENGEPPIWLGGCCVTGNDPGWHCLGCGHEFGLRE